MKIQVLSDLHLEGGVASWLTKFKSEADILILAGDIVTPRSAQRVAQYFGDLSLPVLWVPGNHEYYRDSYPEAKELYRDVCKNVSNLTLMDEDTFVFNNVAFIGATLWSSPDMIYEDRIQDGIADFHAISGFTVDKMRSAHYHAKDYIRYQVEKFKKDGMKTVVITHFAPSFKAQHPMFKGSALSSYFYNRMDDLIDHLSPDLWIYGHTHGNICFNIGSVPVICNQQGYLGETDTNKTFNPNFVYELKEEDESAD